MAPVVNVVLPVFALILVGYLAGRFRLLGDASTEALNRFVYYFALPAMFFAALSRMNPAEIFDPAFLAAYGGGELAVFAAAMLWGRLAFRHGLSEASLFAMGGVFGNTGYMGVPLALLAFGPAGALPAIIATVFKTTVIIALVTILIEIDPRRRRPESHVLADAANAVLRSPLVMSAAGGILWSLIGLEFPKPIAAFLDLLGAAAGPCALFAIGLFLVGKPIRKEMGEIGAMTVIKLAVHPLVTWVLAFHVFAVDPVWATVAVVMAALPAGANCFVVAQRYDIYVARASGGVLLSTLFSVITLSALFSYWAIR
ncbi:MAG: AEC family transporter [Alphaproteobacteria bacterium]|nr:AEC family transporter [Alphaproteobacteria bacterium]